MRRSLSLALGALALGAALVALYFLGEDPDDVRGFVDEPQPAVQRAPAPPPRGCDVTAWSVRGAKGSAQWVGPLDGDAPCTESLPLLCFRPGETARPEGFTLPPQARWTGGEVGLLAEAYVGAGLPAEDACAAKFGSSWRLARDDDGGPFGLAATGELPPPSRFWVKRAK